MRRRVVTVADASAAQSIPMYPFPLDVAGSTKLLVTEVLNPECFFTGGGFAVALAEIKFAPS